MAFLPRGFEPPELVERPDFRLRPITVHDVVRDYHAVLTPSESALLGCVYLDPPERPTPSGRRVLDQAGRRRAGCRVAGHRDVVRGFRAGVP